ncbi:MULTISPECIES: polyprenyl synthetase family protein [unclassified Leucobacter]|uniref:polyprenyl synthetase family protein n=1 Tax=unclassified Leucobacter TaxID=2621730 RepID=UPI00301792C2
MADTVQEQRSADLVTAEIEQQLRELLDIGKASTASLGPHFGHLWDLGSECLLGGKMLRPRLLMGAYAAITDPPSDNVADRRAALRIAAAIELLHFAFLLHDDVIDEDLTRRGAPNVIGRLLHEADLARGEEVADSRALHWARSSGILLGDLMLSEVHQVFAREPLADSTRRRLLDLLRRTTTESVVGEHSDIGLGDRIIPSDLNTVLEMSRLKTATYTFEFPLRAAAVLAGAPPRLEDALGEVARHLGVAFQLQDDLLCAFGDSREHGKDVFSDFREGKETAIIAYARMTGAWPNIEPLLGSPDFCEADAEAIRTLLVECGAEGFVRSIVDERIRAAVEITSREATAMPAALRGFLIGIIDSLDGRRV